MSLGLKTAKSSARRTCACALLLIILLETHLKNIKHNWNCKDLRGVMDTFSFEIIHKIIELGHFTTKQLFYFAVTSRTNLSVCKIFINALRLEPVIGFGVFHLYHLSVFEDASIQRLIDPLRKMEEAPIMPHTFETEFAAVVRAAGSKVAAHVLTKLTTFLHYMDQSIETIFRLAVTSGCFTVVKAIVQNGFVRDSNVISSALNECAFQKPSNLFFESSRIKCAICTFLLENGGVFHDDILHNAILSSNNINVVQYLADNGANVNALDGYGNPLLHRVLVSRPNERGHFSKHRSEYFRNMALVLMKNGANVHAVDSFGRTVLHAIDDWRKDWDYSTFMDNVINLLAHGADPNAKNVSNDQTVLFSIARSSIPSEVAEDFIKYLKFRGADHKLTDRNGTTVAEEVGVFDEIRADKFLKALHFDASEYVAHDRAEYRRHITPDAHLPLLDSNAFDWDNGDGW